VLDIKTSDVRDMATLAGAKALNRKNISRIAVDAKPNFLLIDLNHPAIPPVYDPLRNLLHCAAERAVKAIYVNGRCIASDGNWRGLITTAQCRSFGKHRNQRQAAFPRMIRAEDHWRNSRRSSCQSSGDRSSLRNQQPQATSD